MWTSTKFCALIICTNEKNFYYLLLLFVGGKSGYRNRNKITQSNKKMACLYVTGVIKTTPTALDIALNLLPIIFWIDKCVSNTLVF